MLRIRQRAEQEEEISRKSMEKGNFVIPCWSWELDLASGYVQEEKETPLTSSRWRTSPPSNATPLFFPQENEEKLGIYWSFIQTCTNQYHIQRERHENMIPRKGTIKDKHFQNKNPKDQKT